jgi:hypothetical protein
MRMRHAALFFALLFPYLASNAQATLEQPLKRDVGREMVQQTIYWVEKEGLPPRSKDQYEERKRSVLHFVGEDGETIDREQLYTRLRMMLDTLDTDGHTFLSTAMQTAASTASTTPKAASGPNLLKLIETPAGKVLHLTPPQITGGDEERMREYASDGLRNMQASGLPGQACALVVDLSEQKGGNAWPPMDLLQPLFTEANSGRFVDRDNNRFPIFSLSYLEMRHTKLGGGISNPLQRFVGQPFAFIMNERTASAGEMIAVALLGEGERVRSFGWPSYGMTTANRPIKLPDNAMLVLTGKRYGIANEPIIRGKIHPQVAAEEGDTMGAVLMKAATWAAGHSSLCKAGAHQGG